MGKLTSVNPMFMGSMHIFASSNLCILYLDLGVKHFFFFLIIKKSQIVVIEISNKSP